MLRVVLSAVLGVSGLLSLPALAADPCPLLRAQTAATDVATRTAAYACKENQDWFSSFIDANGRSGGVPVYEAEASKLANGEEAWRRVARYWNESGLLNSVMQRSGASDCAYAATAPYRSPACRSFIIDTPWSAAFISWVMRSAGMPGFRYSGSHIDYVRQAYLSGQPSPYQVYAPDSAKPAPGDMLCSVRSASRIFAYKDLATILSTPESGGLAMHCDLVVGATPGGLAYLVGGNVQQAVTLRMLPVDSRGYFSNLPTRTGTEPECSPDMPQYCDANRTNWAVLLKLKSAAELALLAPPPPVQQQPGMQDEPSTCVDVSGVRVCSRGNAVPDANP